MQTCYSKMTADSSSKNIQYLDILRVLATLAVILIHVNSPLMNMNYGKNMEYWSIGLIINNLVRFAVPTFLVLSGATLLTKQYKLTDFYKKRMSRVLLPALFWLPAYWVFRWLMLRPWQRPHDLDGIVRWGTDLFVREGISIHLWFVYMILFLYLFLPFINRVLQKLNRRTVVFFVIFWLILNSLHSFGIFKIDQSYYLFNKLYGYSLYTGYLVLGYLLHTSSFKINRQRAVAAIVFVLTVVVASISTYLLSKTNGKQTLTMMGTFTINTFIQTLAMYYMVKDVELKHKFFSYLIQLISNYSFGIYLVHIMVISLFFRIGIFWTMAYPLVSVPLVVMLTLLTSIVVIFLLRKIPFMAKFAG